MLLPLLLALAQTPAVPPSEPSGPSAVAVENAKPGAPDWDTASPALAREIEGYASRTSVNRGDTIDIFVSTRAEQYTVDVFRMGWYGGAGARRIAGPTARAGVLQDMPQADPSTGLIECRWRDPLHLRTGDADGPWPSGVYLARITTATPASTPRARRRVSAVTDTKASRAPAQSFVVFVVRDDARDAAIVFQSSVTTFAAYNNWGGKSLYAFNSAKAPARKVSFDRPYAVNPYGVRLDGAGDFLRRWEYNAVRFLEREGYDVKYTTDVDTHERHIIGLNRGSTGVRPPSDTAVAARQPDTTGSSDGLRLFLSVGHDEYWSAAMREHVESARDRGVHLAFLGADVCYWQVRFEPSGRGDPNRTLVAFKEAAGDEDPLAVDGNPQNDRLITGRWRDRPVSRPEERLVGIMYAADPVDGDIVIDDASHWAFEGTGVAHGDALRGLLGYEVDAIYGSGPGTLVRLGHSPFKDQGRTRYGDMTIYTADSGALVFAAGSMQWNWGLDDYNAPVWHTPRANDVAQRVTRNVLRRMLRARGAQPTTRPWMPSTIVLIASAVAIVVVLRAWISSRIDRRA